MQCISTNLYHQSPEVSSYDLARFNPYNVSQRNVFDSEPFEELAHKT